MGKKIKIASGIVSALCVLGLLVFYLHNHPAAVFSPRGPIAEKERALIFFGLGLSLVVVIPVFTMAIFIAWKYRETNEGAIYKPDWDHNVFAESIWWGIPTLLILILSIVAWNSSHTLDPFRPLNSAVTPLTVQVVALDWKWLFIYPQQDIASVNFLEIPNQTPINFDITSDTVMNSFWVPQLGGQVYAMPGMSTELHLLAYKNGEYYGSSANISGAGFASMHFMVKSTGLTAFNSWVQSVGKSSKILNSYSYQQLAKPSSNNAISYYAIDDDGLFNSILNKYMEPVNQSNDQQYGTTMQMQGMGM